MTWEQYEAIQETMAVYEDEALMTDIVLGVQQIRRGETVSWEDAQKELGW